MPAWMFLTRWGNSLLLLPTASCIAAGLWLDGERPIAWRWSCWFGGAVLLVLATKVAFLGWGIGIRALDFTGISGHSTLAAAVLPMLAWWLTQERDAASRARAVAIGAVLAAAVGVSRLPLSAHSASEVVTGLALGFAVAARTIPREPAFDPHGPLRWLVLAALLAVGSVSDVGNSDEAHGIVALIALKLSGHDVVYQRWPS